MNPEQKAGQSNKGQIMGFSKLSANMAGHRGADGLYSARMRITNGSLACEFPMEGNAANTWGVTGNLLLGDKWAFTAKSDDGGSETRTASVKRTPKAIEVELPGAFMEGNPDVVAYERLN